MNKLELRDKQLSVIEAVLTLDDDIILDDLLARLKKPFPCQYSEDEVIELIKEGDKQRAAGQFTPHEEVLSRYKNPFS